MSLIVYLDETGDHSLELVDKEFPIFAIALFICDVEVYTQKIVPAIYQLKFACFKHEGVIFHSRDIRRAQKDFLFLRNSEKRNFFYERINKIMNDYEYTLIASVIRKQKHKDRYGIFADNPYDLALKFAMERLLPLLEEKQQSDVQIVAEGRGKKEGNELRLSFFRIINEGTEYVNADRFKRIKFRLTLKRKAMNIVGTQIADLAAYPIARYVIDPKKPSLSYDIIKKKFYSGQGRIWGLKVFP